MKNLKFILFLFFLSLVSYWGLIPAVGNGEVLPNQITDHLMNDPAPVISSLNPAQGFNSGMIQYTIHGEHFSEKIAVKLVQHETEIQGLYPRVEAGNQIQCFFDLSGKPFGDYDLVLTAPDERTYIFKTAFQIRIFVLVYAINSLMKPIFFDYDQFKIREDQLFVLRGNIELLLENPYYYILLEGYTDPRGSFEYNLGLSVKRVENVRRMLLEAGIPFSRIFSCHHVKGSTSVMGNVEENWELRRVDISLSETPPYKGN